MGFGIMGEMEIEYLEGFVLNYEFILVIWDFDVVELKIQRWN